MSQDPGTKLLGLLAVLLGKNPFGVLFPEVNMDRTWNPGSGATTHPRYESRTLTFWFCCLPQPEGSWSLRGEARKGCICNMLAPRYAMY
jgi:hypothetical protein